MGSVTICNREALNVPLMIDQPLCDCFGRHVTKVTVEQHRDLHPADNAIFNSILIKKLRKHQRLGTLIVGWTVWQST